MPERHINAAIEHIDSAADEIEAYVKRVEATANRKIRWLAAAVAGLVLVIVAMGAGGFLLLDTVRRLDDTIDQQALDREQNRLDVCRSRNSSYVAGRNDLMNMLTFATAQSQDPERAAAFLQQLVDEVLTPIETFHTDCVHDGALTVADYGDIVPDSLPISIP